MIIDSHVHAWADDDSEYPYATERAINSLRRWTDSWLWTLLAGHQ